MNFYLYIGGFDGSIKLYSPHTGKQTQVLNQPAQQGVDPVPITSVRFRPNFSGQNPRASTNLVSLTSDGIIQHWHINSNKLLTEETYHRDKGNNLNCADFTKDGRKLVVAGSDRFIYVYDEVNKRMEFKMQNRDLKTPGHQNRIFSVRCDPQDENVLMTAGWDRSVKIYDIRAKGPVASIGGPQISGDSLDVYDDMIVTGSTRNKEIMQVYSKSHQKLVHTFQYAAHSDHETGFVLSTRFSSDGNFIIAGGAGKNELKVFMNNADSSASFKTQMEIKDLPAAVYTIDKAPNDTKMFAFGLGNGNCYVVNYEVDAHNVEYEPYLNEFPEFVANKIEEDRKKAEEKAKAAKTRPPSDMIGSMAGGLIRGSNSQMS